MKKNTTPRWLENLLLPLAVAAILIVGMATAMAGPII
jgi:hypothetical protein